MQRALMQFFKPENDFPVRDALAQAGRAGLIGGCDGLIQAHPPKEAIEAKRRQANDTLSGTHFHTLANPVSGPGPCLELTVRRNVEVSEVVWTETVPVGDTRPRSA